MKSEDIKTLEDMKLFLAEHPALKKVIDADCLKSAQKQYREWKKSGKGSVSDIIAGKAGI